MFMPNMMRGRGAEQSIKALPALTIGDQAAAKEITIFSIKGLMRGGQRLYSLMDKVCQFVVSSGRLLLLITSVLLLLPLNFPPLSALFLPP